MNSDPLTGDDAVAILPTLVYSGRESLPLEQCLTIHRLMVRARVMEERMIKMSKSGLGHFWIGGPGEEAFNVALGLQIRRGQGPRYDYLHLHYRNSALMLALGMPVIESIRQMAMTATDSHSLGRNFVGHFCKREWNVIPVTSVIEVQYAMAPGTALMQKRLPDSEGVTVVLGGEAGTAEGDFASCLIWSTLPGREVPVLIVVTNNGYGISTPACSVHSERHVVDRGIPFGVPGEVVDGNDPIRAWHAVERGLMHCRATRTPFFLEANVSRLFGHSSSSGALRDRTQEDPIERFERILLDEGVDRGHLDQMHEDAHTEVEQAVEQALNEPMPRPEDVERYTYAASRPEIDAVYPDDYTGLPN
ncbi:MAG: thiamine pyrophosphate-dependent dehydrogenase E1 component subunit alpha [Planctomycetia bacterium]|nr:thiamine pyrophosphate-dependent dehydrogenase E1 component subunit alpha [Planctomycetia bacterium]